MLSVIIPAYNEEEVIASSLHKIISYMDSKQFDYEVIVVDDGSTDNTRGIVSRFQQVILTPKRNNLGKGYSVKQGMLLGKGDYLLFSDADSSTSIEELDKLLRFTPDFEVVIGSRALADSEVRVRQAFYREWMGKIFNFAVRLIAIKGIKDTQCGFKLFSKKATLIIFPKQQVFRWGFDVELLFIAKKKKLNIKEVPIVWINNEQSKVSPVKDAFSLVSDHL